MPPTLKDLKGNVALGFSVCVCVSMRLFEKKNNNKLGFLNIS